MSRSTHGIRSGVAGLAALAWTCVLAPSAVAQGSPAPEAGPPVAARWEGSMAISGTQEAPLVLHLARSPDGAWSGTAGLPGSGAAAAALVDVVVKGRELRFAVPGLPGAPLFAGRFADGFEAIAGEVTRDAPPPPPATDIHLLPVGEDGGLGEPRAATDRDGYDNQPRFLPDSSGFLYTSIHDGQADVYRYDLASGDSTRLTETAESEYSPTPLPGGGGFSTVRVEADGTQRLWRFSMAGEAPELVLPDVAPVGYHGWLGEGRVALFILGSPPTLEIASLPGGERRRLAESVGRAIHATPSGDGVSFVHKAGEDDWRIEILDPADGERRAVIATLPGSEDFVWSADGRLLMAAGSTIHACSPDAEAPAWTAIADLAAAGIDGITRLDISPDGRWLAVVGERPSPERQPERVTSIFELRRVVSES